MSSNFDVTFNKMFIGGEIKTHLQKGEILDTSLNTHDRFSFSLLFKGKEINRDAIAKKIEKQIHTHSYTAEEKAAIKANLIVLQEKFAKFSKCGTDENLKTGRHREYTQMDSRAKDKYVKSYQCFNRVILLLNEASTSASRTTNSKTVTRHRGPASVQPTKPASQPSVHTQPPLTAAKQTSVNSASVVASQPNRAAPASATAITAKPASIAMAQSTRTSAPQPSKKGQREAQEIMDMLNRFEQGMVMINGELKQRDPALPQDFKKPVPTGTVQEINGELCVFYYKVNRKTKQIDSVHTSLDKLNETIRIHKQQQQAQKQIANARSGLKPVDRG